MTRVFFFRSGEELIDREKVDELTLQVVVEDKATVVGETMATGELFL